MIRANRGKKRTRGKQVERCRGQTKVPCPECKGKGTIKFSAKDNNGKRYRFKGDCGHCLGAGVLTGWGAKHLQGKEN